MINDDIITIRNKPDIYFASVSAEKKVTVKWDQAQGCDWYVVDRKREEDEKFSKLAKVDNNVLSYCDDTITAEGIYVYRVIAFKKVPHEKNMKKCGEQKSINITSLEAPKIKSVKTVYDKNGISVEFEGVEGIDRYNIIKRYPYMSKGVRTGEASVDHPEYLDTKLQKGVLYYYSIEAFKRSGKNADEITYSNPSDELCGVLLDKVKVMKVKRRLGKKVNVHVRLTSGADGYILFKANEEDGEYTEAARTNSISALTLSAKGGRGERSAYFKTACYKKADGKEFIGPKSEPFFVKFI